MFDLMKVIGKGSFGTVLLVSRKEDGATMLACGVRPGSCCGGAVWCMCWWRRRVVRDEGVAEGQRREEEAS
jgi:hypothetical protein